MAGRRGGAAMVVVVCCYWGALLMGTAVADGNFLSLALYNFILRCSSLWESGPRFRVTFVRLDVIACTIYLEATVVLIDVVAGVVWFLERVVMMSSFTAGI